MYQGVMMYWMGWWGIIVIFMTDQSYLPDDADDGDRIGTEGNHPVT
jgi:hypothetical protein